MSELTDEQITDLIQKERRSHGHVERNVARYAYALGREAGLKEAVEVCDQIHEGRWSAYRGAGYCADAIRALIDASDSPADVKYENP